MLKNVLGFVFSLSLLPRTSGLFQHHRERTSGLFQHHRERTSGLFQHHRERTSGLFQHHREHTSGLFQHHRERTSGLFQHHREQKASFKYAALCDGYSVFVLTFMPFVLCISFSLQRHEVPGIGHEMLNLCKDSIAAENYEGGL